MTELPPHDVTGNPDGLVRLHLEIHGAVQGVGFRPTVYRLATSLGLAGWIVNDVGGVLLEVEGPRFAVEDFRMRLEREPPRHARVLARSEAWLAPAGFERFEIRESARAGARTAAVLPEIATCAACLDELFDPHDRRAGYPFINCTNCGPRFTILRALPYDRPHTTMAGFTLCARCRAEYEDPANRRFHAQPNACPDCGPSLALWDEAGGVLARGSEALAESVQAIRDGRIVALKGLGGFHLVCDARRGHVVARLRERKRRPEKPLAVMAADLDSARELCVIESQAEAALLAPEAPIVLMPRRSSADVAANVAPGLSTLGVMLPSTPLHHLLTRAVGAPLVATSGNVSDEPIAIDEHEALVRLNGIADVWLVHDRPIERHCDDSVAWVMNDSIALLRRARGYAPLPVTLPHAGETVLAVGAHLKSVVALAIGRQAFLSQHIGDLETPRAVDAFERVIADFLRLYAAAPVAYAHDLHPDYTSTAWAARAAAEHGVGLVAVQHHHAHLASCLAEHGEPGPALGVIWDGTGYGTDGTIWGGEFLLGDASGCERVAHLRPFRLPGGEAAVREPRRTALALLHELLGPAALERTDVAPIGAFTPRERELLGRLVASGTLAPLTSSAGRLFDGLAALLGLHPRVSFEGQAAIALEFVADAGESASYPVDVRTTAAGTLELDWRPLVAAVLDDLADGRPRGAIAGAIHAALADAIALVAARVGAHRVVLSGGCFQNRRLTEAAAARLRAAGHEVLLQRQVPPNDGGVSLGQVAIARALLARQ